MEVVMVSAPPIANQEEGQKGLRKRNWHPRIDQLTDSLSGNVRKSKQKIAR